MKRKIPKEIITAKPESGGEILTKTEKTMKELIEENSSQFINGIWVTDIIRGAITITKEEEFKLIFRETGFERRGTIFSESNIAPYFSDLYLQMLPARFDMILRVCGSMLVRELNKLNPDREKIVMDVKLGIGVKNNSPMSCPYINLQGWGYEGAEPLDDKDFYEIADILAENLVLLTDSFLNELRDIAEAMPISNTTPIALQLN